MKHQPRKRFGQHFLHDQQILNQLINALRLKPEDNLVEVGAGKGALTQHLLEYLPSFHVIEIDRDLIPILQNITEPHRLKIHNIDALKFDLTHLASSDCPLRVVGNLPYNISTPLLFHFFQYIGIIKDMHFMLQKEVVDRMAAEPNNKRYGRLSVMSQYHCHVTKLFDVNPEAFNPPPKVDSAVLRLTPHHTPFIVNHYADFSKIVAQCFNQRRKTIRNSLKSFLNATQIEQLNIDPQARAENVSLKQFIALANAYPNVSKKPG